MPTYIGSTLPSKFYVGATEIDRLYAGSTLIFDGWTPAALFDSGEAGGWWDVGDLSTMWQESSKTTAAAVGQPVGAIDDKSPNANHLTQVTDANRPTLQQDGDGALYLSCGASHWLSSLASNLRITGSMTAVVGAYKTATAHWGHLLSCQTAAATVNSYELRFTNTDTDPPLFLVWADGSTVGAVSSASVFGTIATKLIAQATRETAVRGDLGIYQAGVERTGGATSTVVPTSDAGSEFRLASRKGSPLHLNGRIYQALVIDRILTADELTSVRGFFADRMGIVL